MSCLLAVLVAGNLERWFFHECPPHRDTYVCAAQGLKVECRFTGDTYACVMQSYGAGRMGHGVIYARCQGKDGYQFESQVQIPKRA